MSNSRCLVLHIRINSVVGTFERFRIDRTEVRLFDSELRHNIVG